MSEEHTAFGNDVDILDEGMPDCPAEKGKPRRGPAIPVGDLNALVPLTGINFVELYTSSGGIEPLVAQIEIVARSLVLDPATPTYLDDVKSHAFRVAKAKVAIVKAGKAITEEWREKTKQVNAGCNLVEMRLDALKDEIRAPLTEYEAATAKRLEDARIEAERQAEVARLAEVARVAAMEAEIERLREVERQRVEAEVRAEAEREREKREAQLQAEAAARAKIEAEQAAEKAIADAQRREEEAKAFALKAEQAAIDAKTKAERDAKEAAEKAERDKLAAIEAEKKRATDEAAQKEAERVEKERKEKAAADKAAANKKHRAAVNSEVLDDLLTIAGLNKDHAILIVDMIAKGEVRHVTINY